MPKASIYTAHKASTSTQGKLVMNFVRLDRNGLALLLVIAVILPLLQAKNACADRSYRMVYSFTPTTGTDNRLWVPVPVKWDGQGTVDAEIVEISPATGARSNEQSGNKPVSWPDSELDNNLSVTFDVELAPVTLPVDPNATWGSYATGTQEYQFNTSATSWVQCDDQTIIDQASSIVGSETNPYNKANDIYTWVKNNISYQDGVRQDALNVLSERKGDCAAFSILFVALCRAEGIPARNISGFLAHDQYFNVATQFREGTWNCLQAPRGFSTHVWAEFMLPGGQWMQVDPTHSLFGAIPYERVILSKGNEVLLGWMTRPWFHLPVANSQVHDSSVSLSITYLGTSGIEHPAPTALPTAANTLLLLSN